VEVLKLFLFNPDNDFYQRQISLLTHQPIRAVQREVNKLEKIGLIKKSIEGNRIYYKTNKKCPIFEELKGILLKTTGIAEVLKGNLLESKSIQFAFIYGSYAKGEERLSSDIDLLVVGDIASKRLSSVLSKPKRELNREINYAVFSLQEFRRRIKQKDHFLNAVLKEKKIFIIGREDEFKRTVKSGQVKVT
jgi:predicted nucleotidyltransferase